jgi:hypothetical protein
VVGCQPTFGTPDMDFGRWAPMVRLIAVGGIAALAVTGLTFGRGGRADVALDPKGSVVTQLKEAALQKEAEVHSRPVQSDRIPVPFVTVAAQVEEPDPKPTRMGFGYYFERQRVQGDATEGEYVTVRRACAPPSMPEVCYLPPGQRVGRPLWRD